MRSARVVFTLMFIMLPILPLAGVLAAGGRLEPYLHLPPLTGYIQHAPFSWPVFLALDLLIAIICAPVCIRLVNFRSASSRHGSSPTSFPRWGCVGLCLIALAWLLAWTRFDWFTVWQPYTFLPLWLGYIITINGFSYRRTGSCLLTAHPRYFLLLFPASSLFWWFFEYLNRFVQNWYYLGVESFTPAEYVFHASLCFSTVLPAVLSTEEYVGSFQRLREPFIDMWPVRSQNRLLLALILVFMAVIGLFGIGSRPDFFFPMLWMAPLFLLLAGHLLSGRQTLFGPLARGDWRPVWLPAVAALVCGFFWEMWNFRSLAHWQYSIPYVQRFHLFAMPILGYAGYLPFGLECKVIADMLPGAPTRNY
jgi:hypothetical protein